MAIAKAQCICKTCGKQFEYRAFKNNRRDADSFEEWAAENITECEDCKQARIEKQRNEENLKAAEATREMGYPELIGSEKQKAWANTIRMAVMNKAQEMLWDPEKLASRPWVQYAYEVTKAFLLSKKQAAWWIDHRMMQDSLVEIQNVMQNADPEAYEKLGATYKAIRAGKMTLEEALNGKTEAALEKPAEEPKPETKPERPEAIPEQRKHAGSVDIRIEGEKVQAVYEKDEAFRTIVKNMGFAWKDCWSIKSGEIHGTAENIVAEAGSRLLNAGFAVRFDSEELREKAVNGDYVPMHKRWVQRIGEEFYISWPYEEDLYRAAISLPGAKYDRPGVMVPDRSWKALLDFAEKYDFRITKKSQAKIDQLSGAAETVQPAKVKDAEYQEKDVLKSSREVLDDLKDQ